jgi:DNA processing protein
MRSPQPLLTHFPKLHAGVPDYQICPIGVVLGELKAGRAAKARLVFKANRISRVPWPHRRNAPMMLWMIVASIRNDRWSLCRRAQRIIFGHAWRANAGAELGERVYRGVRLRAALIPPPMTGPFYGHSRGRCGRGRCDLPKRQSGAENHENDYRVSDQPIGYTHARHFVAQPDHIGMARTLVS